MLEESTMGKNNRKIVRIALAIAAAVILIAGVVVVKKLIPSKKVMPLTDYYKTDDDRINVVLQNEKQEEQGLYLNGIAYIDYETVSGVIDPRFYWDANENLLIYTTQSEVIKTELGSSDYYVNKSKASVEYPIVKSIGEKVYIAANYIKMFSNIEYNVYENPERVVIQYDWGEEYLYTDVKKNTQLRTGASIKSDVLLQLKQGDKLVYVDTEEKVTKGFSKVMTEDGIIGYVKNKHVKQAYYKKMENEAVDKSYTHITKDYKINMAWHQVTNQDANENLLNVLSVTKGLNTISPTWFSVTSKEGNISSLASEKYVECAHNNDLEVWALVDDFNKEVDMYELLTYTSRREKLENELIASAIKYELDGINIDFENISSKAGPHYIQFLRELSIKCRNNGVILSVDNYIPASYNSHYNLEAQGEVVDYVVIMAYDEHHAGSEESGSVSSIDYVKDAVADTLKSVSKNQIIMALPFYTRLWSESTDGKVSSVSCGMDQGKAYLEANGVKPKWDTETGQYYGEYQTDSGLNRIWLEDNKSLELKLKAVMAEDVAGVSGWKLGLESRSVWNVILKYVN